MKISSTLHWCQTALEAKAIAHVAHDFCGDLIVLDVMFASQPSIVVTCRTTLSYE